MPSPPSLWSDIRSIDKAIRYSGFKRLADLRDQGRTPRSPGRVCNGCVTGKKICATSDFVVIFDAEVCREAVDVVPHDAQLSLRCYLSEYKRKKIMNKKLKLN